MISDSDYNSSSLNLSTFSEDLSNETGMSNEEFNAKPIEKTKKNREKTKKIKHSQNDDEIFFQSPYLPKNFIPQNFKELKPFLKLPKKIHNDKNDLTQTKKPKNPYETQQKTLIYSQKSTSSQSFLSNKNLDSVSDKLPQSLCPPIKKYKELKSINNASLPRQTKTPNNKYPPINCSRPQSHGEIHRLQRYLSSLYLSIPCRRCKFSVCRCTILRSKSKEVQTDLETRTALIQTTPDYRNKATQDSKAPLTDSITQTGDGTYTTDTETQTKLKTRSRLVGPDGDNDLNHVPIAKNLKNSYNVKLDETTRSNSYIRIQVPSIKE